MDSCADMFPEAVGELAWKTLIRLLSEQDQVEFTYELVQETKMGEEPEN